MNSSQLSMFERNPKKTLVVFWLLALAIFFVVAEISLQRLTGLGHPVLFFEHPSYGYRLQPDQATYRFGGALIKTNNLGLRAKQDWDERIEDKVLFLGDSVTYGGNRISNEELFSELAVQNLREVQSGNIGMPNYGVENVYGLVVESEFLPAKYYVTTFIEHDFYRGLVLPENRPWIVTEMPRFALEELAWWVWHRYFANTRQANQRTLERVPANVRRRTAVEKLKKMDSFLKSRGLRHLVFISPTKAQVLEDKSIDTGLMTELDSYGVSVFYLLDSIQSLDASLSDKAAWFQDEHHLTRLGHKTWGAIISEELKNWIDSSEM